MIEFRCDSCQKLLRVKDEYAGRQAACPNCQTTLAIPMAVSAEEPVSEPPIEDEDWYQSVLREREAHQDEPASELATSTPTETRPCPICGEFIRREAVRCRYCREDLVPRRGKSKGFDIGNVLSDTWELYKEHWGLLTAVTFLHFAIGAALFYGFMFLTMTALVGVKEQEAAVLAGVTITVFIVVFAIIMLYLDLGFLAMRMKIVQGEPVGIGDLHVSGDMLMCYFGASLVFGLCYLLGAMMCVVPGFLVLMMWWPFPHVLLAEDCGALDSLSRAKEITDDHWLDILITYAVIMGLSMLVPMTFYVGIIVFVPFSSLLWTVAFLAIQGKRPKLPAS